MKTLLYFLFYLLSDSVIGQNYVLTLDQKKVETTVLQWCDSTFNTYSNPTFSSYVANFTDEYNMLLLRIESLEKSKSKTIRDYKEGKLSFTEQDFDLKMIDYKKRIDKASIAIKNFKPKVTSYVIALKLDTVTKNNKSIEASYKLTLDNDFKILKKENRTVLNPNDAIPLKK